MSLQSERNGEYKNIGTYKYRCSNSKFFNVQSAYNSQLFVAWWIEQFTITMFFCHIRNKAYIYKKAEKRPSKIPQASGFNFKFRVSSMTNSSYASPKFKSSLLLTKKENDGLASCRRKIRPFVAQPSHDQLFIKLWVILVSGTVIKFYSCKPAVWLAIKESI